MKAIAEYFRDLASDDRYFGAEPPSPDAEMLARIAEREVNRRVEAQIGDSGVHLKTAQPPAATGMPQELPSPAPAAFEPVAQPQPVAASPSPTTAPDTDSIAAKLQRIRAVVEQNRSVETAAPLYSEDENAEELVEAPQDTIASPAPETPGQIVPAETVAETVQDAAPETTENSAGPSEGTTPRAVGGSAHDETAGEGTDDSEPAPQDSTGPETGIETDIETAPTTGAGPEDDIKLASVMDQITLSQEETEPEDYEGEEEDSGNDNAILGVLANVSGTPTDETESTDKVAEADSGAASPKPEDTFSDAQQEDVAGLADTIASVLKDSEASLIAQPDTAGDSAAENDAAPVESAEILERKSKASAAAARARARVIKVKNVDLDNAIAQGQLEEIQEDKTPEVQTSLTPEAEADLKKELEEVARGEDDASYSEREAARLLERGGEDEAVARLLEETNTQLESSESTRRRSAIAHLKAAVAATVADRKLKGTKSKDPQAETGAYRDDLAKVVKPKRRRGLIRNDDDMPAPAPLVLVSEQRIDAPLAEVAAAPIRPRRVAKSNLAVQEIEETFETTKLAPPASVPANIFAESTSFSEFAELMGATELPDLLEAAAAYTAFIEGRPHFTRPQVMKQVAKYSPDDAYSREAGLRSFGQLLREGKIQKIKRGQFTISKTTRFKPEARYAGE